jgi:hypothetical protein
MATEGYTPSDLVVLSFMIHCLFHVYFTLFLSMYLPLQTLVSRATHAFNLRKLLSLSPTRTALESSSVSQATGAMVTAGMILPASNQHCVGVIETTEGLDPALQGALASVNAAWYQAERRQHEDLSLPRSSILTCGTDSFFLSQQDFVNALDGFTPVALQAANLFKSDVAWADVGGLWDVKRVLKETFELPVR